MPTFTNGFGQPFNVDATEVERARPSFSGEIEYPDGEPHTGSVMFAPWVSVIETIDIVGPALQAEVASFVRFTGTRGIDLWCDAAKAADPRGPTAAEAADGVGAVIAVGGIGMRVAESVADVQAALDAARAQVS